MRRRIAAAVCLLASLAAAAPTPARADEGPSSNPAADPADAIQIAEAAFEYRDFQKVVDTLNPWVHPPRITDVKLMIKARRLLGVSFHILGDVRGAREEFSQLLLADPLHKLDPFVIPPKVIETFESVRKEMKPMLDRILAERGLRPEPEDGAKKLVLVEVPSRWVTLLPGGVPQFLLDEPEWGAALASAQLIGVAANLTGFLMERSLSKSDSRYDSWVGVQYAGLGLAIISYAASVLLGNVALEQHTRMLLERAADSAGGKKRAEMPGFPFGAPISIDLP